MGGQTNKNKAKLAKHQHSASHTSGGSSSSGKASSSAPLSVRSKHGVSHHDGPTSPPTSPPLKSPKSAKSPKSPEKSPEKSPRADETALVKSNVVPMNFDLGAAQLSVVYKLDALTGLPLRSKAPSKLGQDAKVALNTFNVTGSPKAKVYQYEVMIGNGVEKRGVVQKVWKSSAVRQAIGNQVLFDGDHLAWGLREIKSDVRMVVDLDKEAGRQSRPGKPDQHRVVIRQRKMVAFDVLEQFLTRKCQFGNSCLEAINCMDHILREMPSQRLVAIKRAFYPKNGERFDLGGGLEVSKGVYQSIRLAFGHQGPCLSVNVDVSNGTFWKALPLPAIVLQMTNRNDINELMRALSQPGKARTDIKRLQKRRVIASHRKGHEDEYVINKFDFNGARKSTFEKQDAKGNKKNISVYDYFKQQYGLVLNYPDLPLIVTPKGAKLPMEILRMAPNQQSKYKLDERQTQNMIKFAVTPPGERWKAVEQGLQTLNWQADPVMRTFGLTVTTSRTVVPARVLTAPKVIFGKGEANPGTSGRWDLKGKQFLKCNTSPLKAWGVLVVCGTRGGKPDKTAVQNFIQAFVDTYIKHGGRVDNKAPTMMLSTGNDPAVWATTAWNTVGKAHGQRPQILMFILPDKNAESYNRIKRSMDCRFGLVSQCVQYSHVVKCQAQYISNVLMKFNAKLGGVTCRAVGAKTGGQFGIFSKPTLIIGADVSHAAPGSTAASVAAITCSMDMLNIQYAAAVESNGYRVEMITEANIKNHLQPMLQHWCANVNNGKLPDRVIYIRDGVAERQFAAVLEQEVCFMKEIFKNAAAGQNVKFVCIIAQKRHHIRFFPERGDRTGNALPGTLVESGATHPFENDFFLCAHAAIKGTARPVHYQVILNEADMSNDDIYTMLYEHSYQYLRATTPVSIHPAVYYAHIASNRGVCHDPKYGSVPDTSDDDRTSNAAAVVSEPWIPMPNEGGIRVVPWYI